MAGCRVTFILLFISISSWAQDRYIVFFKDKNGTPYSISQPQNFLSAKALTRRTHSGVSVTADDLPVNPSYVTQVKGTGAKTFFTSRWMNCLLVETTSSVISTIAALPFVLRIQLVAPNPKLLGGRTIQSKQLDAGSADEVTSGQLQMLGIDVMQADGYHGEGVMISVLDAGFPGVNSGSAFQKMFTEGRVKMTTDFITNSGSVYQFDKHGAEVLSTIAAEAPGFFTGGAYKANFLLFVTEDVATEYRIEEYNWLFAAERADSAGTDVIQSSLGYNTFDNASMDYATSDLNGKTTVITKAAGMARDRGIIVVVSAGNEGSGSWHYITAPADADGILAVGAVNSLGGKASFSSFGPTADGRIKPDVVAQGVNTAVLLPGGSISSANGTSLAAPLISSLVLGLIQAYPALTPSQLVTAIKLSASKGNSPDNSLGYGVPNYSAVKNYLESAKLTDNVMIFPNPVESTLHVAFKDLPVSSVQLTFYDAIGRTLLDAGGTLNWFSNPIQVSLSNLTAGTYYVRIKTSTIIKTFRFVKL